MHTNKAPSENRSIKEGKQMRLTWIYTVSSGLPVRILRVNTVFSLTFYTRLYNACIINSRVKSQARKSAKNELSRKHTYIIFDPLKHHFYTVKLGFTGVYIIFLISAQNVDCGYSLEPPRRGGSNENPQSMFWAEIRKIMYTPVNPSFTK